MKEHEHGKVSSAANASAAWARRPARAGAERQMRRTGPHKAASPTQKVAATLILVLALCCPVTAPNAQFKWTVPGAERTRPADEPPYTEPWGGEDGTAVHEGVIREELPSGPINEKARAVDKEELSPVLAPDGSGLPYELWRGLTAAELGDFFSTLDLPPRSPALAILWRRLVTSEAGGGSDKAFTLRRVEALERSGLSAEALAALSALPGAGQDPLITVTLARLEIGLGNKDRGCELAQALRASKPVLQRPEQVEAAVLAGYCAASASDMTTASLQSSLARELASPGDVGPDLLDAVAGDVAPTLPKGAKLTPIAYRIAELRGGIPMEAVLSSATPALLGILARSAAGRAELKLPAAEKAATMNIIDAADLAALYDTPAASEDAASLERGALYRQAIGERTPLKKARFIRAFLDEERRIGLYGQALVMMAKAIEAFEPIPEIGWFAETAIEISIASGNFALARKWIAFASGLPRPEGTGGLDHWSALADIADPSLSTGRSANLGSVERLAQGTHVNAATLHRLATVLDALEIAVPVSLWELSSRSPQPAEGYLPDTGVLSALADASKRKDFGRTVLLAMKTTGTGGADRAHIIALGDTIRALKRAGLEQEARTLGLEGLFTSWPRTTPF